MPVHVVGPFGRECRGQLLVGAHLRRPHPAQDLVYERLAETRSSSNLGLREPLFPS